MITEFQLLDAPAVPTVVVKRAEVTATHLPELFDATFARFHAAIAEGVVAPSGPPFGLYLRMEDTLDIEIGFPGVLQSPDENLVASELPAGRIASAQYWGGFDGLPLAWAEFVSHVAGQGLSVAGPCWESYVTMPEPNMDPTTIRTDLFCAVS